MADNVNDEKSTTSEEVVEEEILVAELVEEGPSGAEEESTSTVVETAKVAVESAPVVEKETEPTKKEKESGNKGWWYWLKQHTAKRFTAFAGRHKFTAFLFLAVALVSVFVFRAALHPFVMQLREQSALILGVVIAYSIFRLVFGKLTAIGKTLYSSLLVGIFGLSVYETVMAEVPNWLIGVEHAILFLLTAIIFIFFNGIRKCKWKGRIFLVVMFSVVIGGFLYTGANPYQYLRRYFRYKSLNIVELKEDPTTKHVRVNPLMGIYSTARSKLNNAEHLSMFDFVREGGNENEEPRYYYTSAIGPKYNVRRFFGGINQLIVVSAISPSPSFSDREEVNFNVGENLLFSSRSYSNVVKKMSPWRYLNYQPMDVKYVKNDKGEWVQINTLMRWRGLIFPYPEFGGVHVIPQGGNGGISWAKRVFFGSGEWVPEKKIADHKYLKGQNIISYKVSRCIADSFRHQKGFWAPISGNHDGDIRTPDQLDDGNDLPFTTCWNMRGNEAEDGMYHYFPMEPYSKDKTGLAMSIFVPTDNSKTVYIIKHYNSNLTGVSPISGIVKGEIPNYDWSSLVVAEQKPYWFMFDGKVQKFWLSSIVVRAEVSEDSDKINTSDTANNEEEVPKVQFAPSSGAKTVFVDADTGTVIFPVPADSSLWLDAIKKKMSGVWELNKTTKVNPVEAIKKTEPVAKKVEKVKTVPKKETVVTPEEVVQEPETKLEEPASVKEEVPVEASTDAKAMEGEEVVDEAQEQEVAQEEPVSEPGSTAEVETEEAVEEVAPTDEEDVTVE